MAPGVAENGTDDPDEQLGERNSTEQTTTNGDHDHTGDEHEIEGPDPNAEVSMVTTEEGPHFEPHVVRIETGGHVIWMLESGSHSATAYHADNDRPDRVPAGTEGWDSGVLDERGATFEQTFETAGVYDYFCLPHEGDGMLGTVVVGDPDPDGQPGLAPPQNSIPSGARERIESLNERVRSALEADHRGTDTDATDGHDNH